jgi:hypothetical protein
MNLSDFIRWCSLESERRVIGKCFFCKLEEKKNQFVEVSDTYLMACDARVPFVRMPQSRLPADLQSRYTIYAETADRIWTKRKPFGQIRMIPMLSVSCCPNLSRSALTRPAAPALPSLSRTRSPGSDQWRARGTVGSMESQTPADSGPA